MQITDISISYEATQSLSNYSNVRPGIRLTAHLDEGDSPETVKATLLDEARTMIHEEIDDALIADGQPPRHYIGPRYRVLYERQAHIVVILPDDDDTYSRLPSPGDWVSSSGVRPSRQMRLDQARDVAARLAAYMGEGSSIVDCYDGDLSRLVVPEPGDPNADPTQLPDEDEEDDDSKQIPF